MQTAAIFGGSFDPPHIGHVLATQYLLAMHKGSKASSTSIDAVWWVPCLQHYFDKQLTAYSHRLQLCKLSTSSLPRRAVRVSDIEKKMHSDGRMLLVLQALAKQYPSWRFRLAIGEDILQQAKRWYKFRQIKRDFGIVVIPRGGKNGIIDIDSTSVRRRLRAKKPVTSMLQPGVVEYIRKHKLYLGEL